MYRDLPLRTAVVAGGVAGPLVVAGIETSNKLLAVQNVAAAGANLVDEFTVSDTDEIDNTGGTATTGMILLVIWLDDSGGRFEGTTTQFGEQY